MARSNPEEHWQTNEPPTLLHNCSQLLVSQGLSAEGRGEGGQKQAPIRSLFESGEVRRLTYASDSISVQSKASVASTAETARAVVAHFRASSIVGGTLVDIWRIIIMIIFSSKERDEVCVHFMLDPTPYPPLQSRSLEASWKPLSQLQVKEPSSLAQVVSQPPLLVAHSLISERQMERKKAPIDNMLQPQSNGVSYIQRSQTTAVSYNYTCTYIHVMW